MAASIEGIFWPKIFWDFATKRLDSAVKPIPFLQIINLVLSLFVLAYEWPHRFLYGTILHRMIRAKLFALPLPILAAALMYQSTDPAIYYMIGVFIYLWAVRNGETIRIKPPKRYSKNNYWPSHRVCTSETEIPLEP